MKILKQGYTYYLKIEASRAHIKEIKKFSFLVEIDKSSITQQKSQGENVKGNKRKQTNKVSLIEYL